MNTIDQNTYYLWKLKRSNIDLCFFAKKQKTRIIMIRDVSDIVKIRTKRK